MQFYIKLTDANSLLRSFMRFEEEEMAKRVFAYFVEEGMQKGESIQLMNRDFEVLWAYPASLVESNKANFLKGEL